MPVKYTKLDDWGMGLLVDPLDKQSLTVSEDGTHLVSSYGRMYPILDDVFDLRLLSNETTKDQKLWKDGQLEYEKISRGIAQKDAEMDYFSERKSVTDVYKYVPVEGDCLDVGGHQGRLRAFLDSGQNYITCDPFLNVFDTIEYQNNLLKAYPFLLQPVNFVCCDAEFLPFRDASFDTVHMRSVIDHFLNPELALNEAYRVLKENGKLIVGLYVRGGKYGREPLKTKVKEFLRTFLTILGLRRYRDHHVFHPTYRELTNLIQKCGFDIETTHWQKNSNDTVCYIKSVKAESLVRR